MVLTTTVGPEAIRDVFIFVEDDCELAIERAQDQATGAQDAPPAMVVAANTAAAAKPKVRDAAGPAGPGATSSIRVSTEKLDQLVNLVG